MVTHARIGQCGLENPVPHCFDVWPDHWLVKSLLQELPDFISSLVHSSSELLVLQFRLEIKACPKGFLKCIVFGLSQRACVSSISLLALRVDTGNR